MHSWVLLTLLLVQGFLFLQRLLISLLLSSSKLFLQNLFPGSSLGFLLNQMLFFLLPVLFLDCQSHAIDGKKIFTIVLLDGIFLSMLLNVFINCNGRWSLIWFEWELSLICWLILHDCWKQFLFQCRRLLLLIDSF